MRDVATPLRMVFEGAQFRVILEVGEPGYKCSSGIYATIESEDDTNWFADFGCDATWMHDLENVVHAAALAFRKRAKKDGRWPYPKGDTDDE